MRWSSLCEKVHTVWTLTDHKSSHHFFGDVIRFGRCEFWKIHVLLRPSLNVDRFHRAVVSKSDRRRTNIIGLLPLVVGVPNYT